MFHANYIIMYLFHCWWWEMFIQLSYVQHEFPIVETMITRDSGDGRVKLHKISFLWRANQVYFSIFLLHCVSDYYYYSQSSLKCRNVTCKEANFQRLPFVSERKRVQRNPLFTKNINVFISDTMEMYKKINRWDAIKRMNCVVCWRFVPLHVKKKYFSVLIGFLIFFIHFVHPRPLCSKIT